MAHFHELTIAEVRRETRDCVSLSFEVPERLRDTFAYQAGQYLTLRATIAGKDVRRSYSLCSSPLEAQWRVAIKQVPGGVFSTYANEQLSAGDTLQVMPPMGSFVAPPAGVRHVLGFAAGSGITPILGITKVVLARDPAAQVTLFYGNKAGRDVIFHEQLEALKNTHLTRLSVYHVLSREHLGIDLFHGRMDAEKATAFAKTLFDPASVDEVYLCGPEPMIRAVSEGLETAGIPKQAIHFELFGAPKPTLSEAQIVRPARRQADLSRVAITFEDKTTVIDMLDDGSHLLEAGLSYGLDLPFACKGGVCSTCKCKVLEGEVLMDVNYALEPDEVAEGFVLSCRASPVSESVAVTFDV